MDDLSYSINVMQRSFMTWYKHHVRSIVLPKSIKRDVMDPQSMTPGASDVVRRMGRHVFEGVKYVYKIYRFGQDDKDENRGYVWREWMILYYCRSPFIYRPLRSQVLLCYNKVREVGHCFAIAKSTLSLYIEQDRIATEEEYKRLAVQLVKAVYYLHERGIIHGDLKPDNILITTNHDILLADLGSVRLEGLPQNGMNSGTTAFQSPARLKTGKCSLADDIWALGVTFWWMKYKKWMIPMEGNEVIDYQFFWAKFHRGLIPHEPFELSLMCWKEETTIRDLMKYLQIEQVVIPSMKCLQNITREEMGGHEFMWQWAQSVQNGLHVRGASYNRAELIKNIKKCFEYVWLDGKEEMNSSVLYHMLHISDLFCNS